MDTYPHSSPLRTNPFFFLVLVLSLILGTTEAQARKFSAFSADYTWSDVFPGADRFGPLEGTPPAAAAYRGDTLLGYAFNAADVVSSIGYSGKPIKVIVGLGVDGKIVGAKLVEHHEPILLIGIPEKKLFDFIARYPDTDLGKRVEEVANGAALDAISGATVTAIVVDASITRAAVKVARSRNIAGFTAEQGDGGKAELAHHPFEAKGWETLLGEGSVRRLHLSYGEVDQAFAAIGHPHPQPFEEWGQPDETFIDFHGALATPALIGRNLLGDAEYENLLNKAAKDQYAILLMANGGYSFRGSGFVRGGIFDRFQLVQGDLSILFRDKNYKRLGALEGDAMPPFAEVGLFMIPKESGFDPVKPWRVELLAQRFTGPVEKVFTRFTLDYQLPESHIHREAPPPQAEAPPEEPLWQRIWRDRSGDLAVLALALGVLTLAFFFQDWLVRHPVFFQRFKYAYLTFTFLWLGLYAQAQLSVVNVFTFINAFMSGFRWDFFLLEPLIFVLWSAVAGGLLFWGRGPYCGWLCPFGALQELTNKIARHFKVPQWEISFYWHERLWPFKYILLLLLFAISLHDMATAEFFSEVEPFKTSILLYFVREFPFVLYALALIVAGLFMHRFFCRYICPLGAALAIPGKIRMFEWLKRRPQCGSECQICSQRCHIQAIHPEGQINPNECFYCLDCQMIYHDDHLCPPLVQTREREERRRLYKSRLVAKGGEGTE